mmetsp:Transcript_17906/g.52325  ORF Transcript_17906/g.52325 Transcript_17906/m.52325 type:complete len:204 (-) Transcript_17906:505-1116(-)
MSKTVSASKCAVKPHPHTALPAGLRAFNGPAATSIRRGGALAESGTINETPGFVHRNETSAKLQCPDSVRLTARSNDLAKPTRSPGLWSSALAVSRSAVSDSAGILAFLRTSVTAPTTALNPSLPCTSRPFTKNRSLSASRMLWCSVTSLSPSPSLPTRSARTERGTVMGQARWAPASSGSRIAKTSRNLISVSADAAASASL